MRRSMLILAFAALPIPAAIAQAPNQSIASTLDVYAFPKDGQSSEQQSKDESACYDWAQSNTGVDPFAAQKQAEQSQQQAEQQMAQAQGATKGAGAAGAVGGAAAGALIGEIAGNDVGNSAGWGAAVGLVAARRRAHAASEQAQEQAAVQGATQVQASAEQIDNFKKAFSACLEGKNHMVKY
ncbi:MAG: glycine zipper family protein [Woeseiaceae bacterium]